MPKRELSGRTKDDTNTHTSPVHTRSNPPSQPPKLTRKRPNFIAPAVSPVMSAASLAILLGPSLPRLESEN